MTGFPAGPELVGGRQRGEATPHQRSECRIQDRPKAVVGLRSSGGRKRAHTEHSGPPPLAPDEWVVADWRGKAIFVRGCVMKLLVTASEALGRVALDRSGEVPMGAWVIDDDRHRPHDRFGCASVPAEVRRAARREHVPLPDCHRRGGRHDSRGQVRDVTADD